MKNVTSLNGLEAVDGVIVVYSCSDSHSFNSCLDLLDFFKFDCKSTINKPALVIGNKTDLKHLRLVNSINSRMHFSNKVVFLWYLC